MISINTSSIKNLIFFNNNNLYRRQYYSSSPFKNDDYFESILLENISDVNFTYA